MSRKLTVREAGALRNAANQDGGWVFGSPKTTEQLAQRGYFVREHMLGSGTRWRITQAGRDALHSVMAENAENV